MAKCSLLAMALVGLGEGVCSGRLPQNGISWLHKVLHRCRTSTKIIFVFFFHRPKVVERKIDEDDVRRER